MIGLLLDTTLKGALVGVMEADAQGAWRLLSHLSVEDNVAATARLPWLVQDGLTRAGVALADVRCMAVGQGPGSFTGIKIGLSFAQGFALGDDKSLRLFPVSALACLVDQERREGRASLHDLYLLPATRTEGYGAYVTTAGSVALVAVSLREDGLWVRSEHETVSEPVHGRCPMRRGIFVQPWPGVAQWCAGSHVNLEEPEFSKLAKTTIMGMADAAMRAWQEGGPVNKVSPRYFRLSAPEEKLLLTAKDRI